MHSQKYFDELSKVKNAIGTYQAVKDIISRQVQIVKEYSTAFNLSKQDKNFTPQEIDYMQQVYTGILDESLKSIEQVQMVITAFVTQMTDAKRLEIINTCATNMSGTYNDLKLFNTQNIVLSLQRSKDENDINTVKALYGIQ